MSALRFVWVFNQLVRGAHRNPWCHFVAGGRIGKLSQLRVDTRHFSNLWKLSNRSTHALRELYGRRQGPKCLSDYAITINTIMAIQILGGTRLSEMLNTKRNGFITTNGPQPWQGRWWFRLFRENTGKRHERAWSHSWQRAPPAAGHTPNTYFYVMKEVIENALLGFWTEILSPMDTLAHEKQTEQHPQSNIYMMTIIMSLK